MFTNPIDREYIDVLDQLLTHGVEIVTRNSRVKRIRNVMLTFDSTPLLTVRKVAWRSCLREWEWFMSGSSFLDDLHPAVHPWWKPWADEDGQVRNNYSVQLRDFAGASRSVEPHDDWLIYLDQINYLLEGIKKHPYSRRLCGTTWNSAEMIRPGACTPITNCHGSWIQALVDPGGTLHLSMVQRSCDVICGFPHNVLQYWAFLLWLAQRTGNTPGTFCWHGVDVHLYESHWDLARQILAAERDCTQDSPQLVYTSTSETFKADDFTLDAPYEPVLDLKAEMIV